MPDPRVPASSEPRKITHGRHCICSACAAEDWTNPQLACCGMHGPSCPREYAPLGGAGQRVPSSEPRPENPYRLAREVENDALGRMASPGLREQAWDEGFAAGLPRRRARELALALLDSEAADVHQRALFVMFEAIFDDDDMPAAGDYYRISRAALAAVRQLVQENTDA